MPRVQLLGIPAAAFVRLQRHVDDLLRELEIIEVGYETGVAPLAAADRHVIRSLLAHYADARASAREQAEAAVRSGRAHLDMELDLPLEAAEAATELVGLFEQADELSRTGVLLSVAPAPELTALRRWTADELWRQLRHGEPPTPYAS